jgi:hypothetical protein
VEFFYAAGPSGCSYAEALAEARQRGGTVMELRRVVTGTAGFTEEALGDAIPVGSMDFFMLWGTESDRAKVGSQDSEAVLAPYWPAVGGTRWLLVRWAPASVAPEPAGDPGQVEAEIERHLPGLLGSFEADSLGMHTSDTIDYGVCLEGEMWLGLDEGREVHLTPGTCVVQRGTRHVWENRSDRPALMMFVLVGAERPA